MSNFALRRLAQLPILLLVIYTITFTLAWLAPGNPLEVEGRQPPAEVAEQMKAQYNLDDPVKFYLSYLNNALFHFDLGPSLKYKDWSVNQIIADTLPVSVVLGFGAITLAMLLGIPAGIVGAVKRDTVWDFSLLSVALIGISLPSFVTGSVLLLIFCLGTGWAMIGWGNFNQMVLPIFTLSLPFAAYIARLTRMGMIEVMGRDFVRTARAKGLSERRVIYGHALKVAFLPVLSFLGPAAAAAMTGSFVIEQVFNIPGLGEHFVNAVINKDLFLVMGVVLLYSTMLIIFNLLVDLAYGLVDPRIELT